MSKTKQATTNTNARKNQYYLMRHGESHANKNGLIVSHVKHALNDYGLTVKGTEQVMDAALNTELDRRTMIISSDFKRASETAQIMHRVIDCKPPLEHSELLRERGFGDWELSDHDNYETVWRNDINHPDKVVNNVETVHQTLDRIMTLINQLEKKHNNESILLVGHGDVLQILLAHFHNVNPIFHRSLNSIGNADIRSLATLDLNNS